MDVVEKFVRVEPVRFHRRRRVHKEDSVVYNRQSLVEEIERVRARCACQPCPHHGRHLCCSVDDDIDSVSNDDALHHLADIASDQNVVLW